MNVNEINEQYKYISQLLKHRRLKEALIQLEPYLYESKSYELKMQWEQLQTSYDYMLQYMKQGVNDPERSKLYHKLLASAFDILDQARMVMLDESSTQFYHTLRRKHQSTNYLSALNSIATRLESFNDDLSIGALFSTSKQEEILKQHEGTLKELFTLTFINSAWSPSEASEANKLCQSELIPTNAKSLFVSAIMLSLLRCFDINKFNSLIEIYQNNNTIVSQRALTSLVIVAHFYSERLNLYADLDTRFEIAAEKMPLATDLKTIYQQILMCQETEKIDKKMRDEIIPEMIKNASKIQPLRFDADENDDENNEINPDWENLLDQPGLGDKLRQMSELQMEGADVQMSTFANLKGFTFFKEMEHWFYIFDKQQPDVHQALSEEKGENKMFNIILESGMFCNSDKYSLLFITQQLPPSQRHMMFSQLTEQQLDQFMDSPNADTFKKMSEQSSTISNQYLQDLYRFCKLSYYRTDYPAIFKEDYELHDLSIFKNYLNNEETLLHLLDFYIKKEHWNKAAKISKELVALNTEKSNNADVYQKMGYAFQKLGNYDEAIAAYLKSDTIRPNNQWNNKRIATCCRLNKEYANALSWYLKVLEVTPENNQTLYFTALCLLELNNYEEALSYFFKLNYLANDSIKAWRGIAWCSFVIGKLEQAVKYSQKIIESDPVAADYLNAGHTACCMKSLNIAVEYYQKAIELLQSRERFIELFYKDKNYLIGNGVAEEDLPLIADLL